MIIMLTQIMIPPPRGTLVSLSLFSPSKTSASLPSIAFSRAAFFQNFILYKNSIKNLAMTIETTEEKKARDNILMALKVKIDIFTSKTIL